MWLLWMKHNTIVRDRSIPHSERRKSGEECERLINLEYEITEQLDNFFNEKVRY